MANDRNRESTRKSGQRGGDEKDSRRMPGAGESGMGESGNRPGQGGGSDRGSGMGDRGRSEGMGERGRSELGESEQSQRGSNPTSGEEENEDVEEPGEE
jgi:hypothetical protein